MLQKSNCFSPNVQLHYISALLSTFFCFFKILSLCSFVSWARINLFCWLWIFLSVFSMDSTTLLLSDRQSTSASNVSISPFISFPIWTALPLLYTFCPSVTGQRLDGDLAGPWAQKIILTGQSERGPIPVQPLGKPERRPRPPVSHSLFYVLDALQIEHHPPALNSHFVNDRSGKEESGNRHENDVHLVLW